MTQHSVSNNDQPGPTSPQYWDDMAGSFDDEPDHGLRDPMILEAWTRLLASWLPAHSITVLDIGCGTGALSVLLSRLGYVVTGIDLSPAMIARAQQKARMEDQQIEFQVMNAEAPEFPPQHFDAIVCRHLLWALPDFPQALRRWVDLLKADGRLILIEGYWNTGAGLHAADIIRALPPSLVNVGLHSLSHEPLFWGRAVSDERYAIVAECCSNG